ncbi:hypothetical protein [Bacillus sp. FJAT-27251]|uniref:hypothetical protein n=1 Tax=Bacillus sp. FJAT-27251 TaxID=1684142 RepID=UPI0018D19032|nr:hypothetical protein [Bacillus sp. FJAT-27251]
MFLESDSKYSEGRKRVYLTDILSFSLARNLSNYKEYLELKELLDYTGGAHNGEILAPKGILYDIDALPYCVANLFSNEGNTRHSICEPE